MPDSHWLAHHTHLALQRLLPRLNQQFDQQLNTRDWDNFKQRLETHFPTLFEQLLELYGQHHDFYYHLENTLTTLAQSWQTRPTELKELDTHRETEPNWFQSNQVLGGVCYVDLFAGNLNGLIKKIPYFKELGLTYLHLMPLFKAPAGNSDGGYAVSSYREVNPALGTLADLQHLAAELRHNGISLVLDFIFNHTSDEHEWALRAKAGEREYQDFYLIFPDRQLPNAYERTLREIFPDEHPGAFTPCTFQQPDGSQRDQWVWTTFHAFQWDLNYANPALFTAMAAELLAIANCGVEVIRLDAVAFIWKQLGTTCENLPQAHLLIRAFNTLARIAAPALLFKSEAIVHPDEVVKYIRPDECQLSYNPLLMALLWESLATRQTRLLTYSMQQRFAINPHCAWVNYVRVHDDIGWTFSDEDAAHLGINGYDHRRFLNQFFTNRFPGSFARGLPFQENPKTSDCRISGTCASLAGLEKALTEETNYEVELALRRILLIHTIILTIGGIPLIYLGDEIGTLNDYDYCTDPAKANDSRWVHRPFANWDTYARRTDPNTIEGRLYAGLQKLIGLRQQVPALSGGQTQILDLGNEHVFGFVRSHTGEGVTILANFSETMQGVAAPTIGALVLEAYQCVVLGAGRRLIYASP